LSARFCVPATDDIDGLIRDEILDMVDNEPHSARVTIAQSNLVQNEAMRERTAPTRSRPKAPETAFEPFMTSVFLRPLIEIRKADDVREALASRHATGPARSQSRRTERSSIQKNQQTKYGQHARTTARKKKNKNKQRNDFYATNKKLEALSRTNRLTGILARILHANRRIQQPLMASLMQAGQPFGSLGQQANLETLSRQFALYPFWHRSFNPGGADDSEISRLEFHDDELRGRSCRVLPAWDAPQWRNRPSRPRSMCPTAMR